MTEPPPTLETPPACPLCHNAQRFAKKSKPLYGTPVCSRCYYSFANRRQVAYLLDSIVIQSGLGLLTIGTLAGLVIYLETQGPLNTTPNGLSTADILIFLGGILFALLIGALFCFKDGFRGRSPFKALLGVRVVDTETGELIGFGQSFKRNLPHVGIATAAAQVPVIGAFASLGVYIAVAVQLCAGPRLGDTWAKTKVIWDKHRDHPIFSNSHYCDACGYDLRATNEPACPECGHAITPDKRANIDLVRAGARTVDTSVQTTQAGPTSLSDR
ncbi:MAG: RDD family protein [Planctomycetota bacterium]